MGFEPGKKVLDDKSAPQPKLDGAAGIPGKATLTDKLPTAASAIGDPYIEGKGHCATGTTDGCFLTATQRALLVSAYQQEVLAAQAQYSAALTEVKLERLIQKDEELPMLYGLMLDVLGTQLLAGLSSAFKTLRSAPETEIAKGIEGMIAFQSGEYNPPDFSLRKLVEGANESAISFILKTGIDETKKSVKKPTPSGEKAVALSYIDRLQETAALAWEAQRQGPPGQANDGELIVLFHSFKAKMGHVTPRYAAALKEKIDRFLSSPVSRIGRNAMRTQRDMAVQKGAIRDTKVVWVVIQGQALPQLYYYKQDSNQPINDYTLEHTEQPLDNYSAHAIDERFKIDKPVEPEFVQTAIAKHQEAWGEPIETKLLDPALVPHFTPPVRDVHDLTQYVPPHVQAARAAKPPAKPAQDPAPIAVPDALVLKGSS